MPETAPTTQSAASFIKPVSNPNLAAVSQPEAAQSNLPPAQPVAPVQQTAPVLPPSPMASTPQATQPQAQQNYGQNVWDAFAAQQRVLELERINREQQDKLQQMQAKQQEQNTTIDNLLKTQAEYDNLKQLQDAANIDYSNLTTVDPNDAKFIRANQKKIR